MGYRATNIKIVNEKLNVNMPFVRGEQPLLAQVGMVVSRSVHGEAPKRQLLSTPIAVSGNAYPANQINSFEAVIHMQVRLTSGS